MLIDNNALDLVFKGFKAVYTDAYINTEINWDKIAMQVASAGRDETYGWLGQFPQLREWLGDRHVMSLRAHSFAIANRDFESTVSVKRSDIADDRLGVFKPTFSEMGQLARTHPEELIMGLLARGFDTMCFDGQNFFDTDHPIRDRNDEVTSVSNMQAGTGAAWFLLDTSRAVRPIIWQEREGYEFESMVDPTNPHVFMRGEYIYGVRARVNAGFGLWQLAFGSKAPLNVANYGSARALMQGFRADGGRILGVRPTTLVVPPSLEQAALEVINMDQNQGGASNPWKGTAKVIVTPFVDI